MADDDERGGAPDFVTFTQIAARLTERGIIEGSITRQGVRYIADTDPEWPVPSEQWLKIGNSWAMPWAPVEKFFRERKVRSRGPDTAPRRKPGSAKE